jgi:MFS family permease
MGSLVQAIAGFSVAFVYDRYGRKWTAFGAGLLSIVGVAVQFTAQSRSALLAGKLVNGFAMGMVTATAQTYVSEVVSLGLFGRTFLYIMASADLL